MPDDIYVKHIEQQDPRLGRYVRHDPASRGFPMRLTIDKSTWRDKSIRIYDPTPNPDQCHGECTYCAKCMEFNAVGNRIKGRVLGMDTAHAGYSLATTLDSYAGSWTAPTWEDTGSNGLAACKAAQQRREGGEYRWYFGGADEIVQAIQDGWVVNLGSWWHWDMFRPDADGLIKATGGYAGGHQYIGKAYWKSRDWVGLRCWWGTYRDVWIPRTGPGSLDTLMHDDGDAHSQQRLLAA